MLLPPPTAGQVVNGLGFRLEDPDRPQSTDQELLYRDPAVRQEDDDYRYVERLNLALSSLTGSVFTSFIDSMKRSYTVARGLLNTP